MLIISPNFPFQDDMDFVLLPNFFSWHMVDAQQLFAEWIREKKKQERKKDTFCKPQKKAVAVCHAFTSPPRQRQHLWEAVW